MKKAIKKILAAALSAAIAVTALSAVFTASAAETKSTAKKLGDAYTLNEKEKYPVLKCFA